MRIISDTVSYGTTARSWSNYWSGLRNRFVITGSTEPRMIQNFLTAWSVARIFSEETTHQRFGKWGDSINRCIAATPDLSEETGAVGFIEWIPLG